MRNLFSPGARQPNPDRRPLAQRTDDQAFKEVPYGLRVASEWGLRFIIVVVATGVLLWLMSFLTLLIIPLMAAALLATLLSPLHHRMRSWGVPNGLSVLITILAFLGFLAGSIAMVGQQLVTGFAEMWGQVVDGWNKIMIWLADGPLHVSSAQIENAISDFFEVIQSNSNTIISGAMSFGSTAGNFAAGSILALFALVFFLLDGKGIWRFLLNFTPRRDRQAIEGAGYAGWDSLGSYVRVQVFVAAVDAVGIGLGALLLGVPFALPLGVLVFLGSFIPIVGAVLTGAIAVLLALIANGWLNALIMLGVVLLVQQVESNILQPLVMGKAVQLHPLAVVLAVTGGTTLAGIVGAVFAVPLLALVNRMVQYLAKREWISDPRIQPATQIPSVRP
ncbi:AI-2E family transporter [Micrococcoides hystricis]|uniref:AI-2E family transporter n=1 Tax=Micrococcoides hystricis TaxID=1572761 RepID=A0ABV6PCA5_9MICC